VAESGTLEVERYGQVAGVEIALELHQHIGEAVNGVCGKTFGIGQFPNGIKGAEDIIASVDENKGILVIV
jgi:hypothetical protein